MNRVLVIVITVLASGCTVIRTDNLQVHLLCKKDLLTHELEFNRDMFNHNHCDVKKNQLFFTYQVPVR